MENVVATPHFGGNTADNDLNMNKCCFENILALDRGEAVRARDVVNNHLISSKIKVN
jgi:phosphoglycerate dehydrogenase-like enzyme